MTTSISRHGMLSEGTNNHRIHSALIKIGETGHVPVPAEAIAVDEDELQAASERFKAAQQRFHEEMQRFESAEQCFYQSVRPPKQPAESLVEANSDFDRAKAYIHPYQIKSNLIDKDERDPHLKDVLAAYGTCMKDANIAKTGVPREWLMLAENRISSAPCFVKSPDGHWYELACPICRGNASSENKEHQLRILGVEGLIPHLGQAHGVHRDKMVQLKVSTLIERLSVSRVAPQQVYWLRTGIAEVKDYVEIREVSGYEAATSMVAAKLFPASAVLTPTERSLAEYVDKSRKVDAMESLVYLRGSKNMCVIKYPCVVRHPHGTWFLLGCPICYGNCHPASDTGEKIFLKGTKGFRVHLIQEHGEVNENPGVAEVIERCRVRELTIREVAQLSGDSKHDIVIERMCVKRSTAAPADALTPTASTKRKASAEHVDHDDVDGDHKDYENSTEELQAKKQKPLESSADLQDTVYAEDVEEPTASALTVKTTEAGAMRIPIRGRPMA
ncbi:hypothetical protein LTR97_005856 [Elasticomyces elasticus]|uniref:Uncharacterized protein n=1 Tax=Elasticomyces elasticus TaxID=574655 RepID=A0AAN7ZNH0_9PEZI|nr:hypothetical protein LTR97_005856 [Elasticomyces elasticus]